MKYLIFRVAAALPGLITGCAPDEQSKPDDLIPPAWEGKSHYHELEIFQVIEGELEHSVNGVSYILQPGMVGTSLSAMK